MNMQISASQDQGATQLKPYSTLLPLCQQRLKFFLHREPEPRENGKQDENNIIVTSDMLALDTIQLGY